VINELFKNFSISVSKAMGSPWAFTLAVTLIVLWACLGPLFGFSDTWQLVINTSTTIITFLMVFLIQNTQNRDARVSSLKLDELIRASKGARDAMIELQVLSDDDLDALEDEFNTLRTQHGHLQHSLATVERVVKAHRGKHRQ
jgi:low affinity Fe/Cu permease